MQAQNRDRKIRLNCGKYDVLVFWVVLLFLYGCQGQTPTFTVTETERAEIQETVMVEVDNSNNLLPKFEIYYNPYRGKSLGVENLVANGGEPFRSIRMQIWEMYGEPVEAITLSVPPRTHREFTLLITKYNYRGIVEGEVIEANKIRADQDAVYFYPFNANIEIESQQDISCSP